MVESLIFIAIVIIVLALVLYGISLLPILDETMKKLVSFIAVIIAVLVIVQRLF
jgi:hypothetical protein